MSTVILRGEEAIHYAETHHLPLNKVANDAEGAREGLSVEEARRIQATRPGLIWIETHIAVNSAEPVEH